MGEAVTVFTAEVLSFAAVEDITEELKSVTVDKVGEGTGIKDSDEGLPVSVL